jgi:hypothetical protein
MYFNQGRRSFGYTLWGEVLEEREDDDLLYSLALAKQHHQPVDAKTPPSTRHQAVLQRLHELRIAWSIFPLDRGVIQLGVAVDELPPADKELEAGSEVRTVFQRLGQGGKYTRVIDE